MARTKRKVNPLHQPDTAQKTAQPEQCIYRAAGYARLSMEDSGRPGADTIESQKELVRNYIEAQPDMEFTAMYCDNGHTGTSFSRPGFDALMQDVRDGKTDCIVVKDLSRFGRNYREAGNYIERIFPFMGVRFVALTDNFDTLHAERSGDGYIVPLKNMLNEMYSRDMSKKVSTALREKQKRGELVGAAWAAYGYRRCADDPHRIEPDEETAPVVREIFHMRVQGMGYNKIARELNRRGIPAPSRYHYLKGDTKCARYADVVWQPQVTSQILCNEVYLGHMVQGRCHRSVFQEKRSRAASGQDLFIVRNTHEPLVDENTFHTVQEMAARQKNAYLEGLKKNDGLLKKPNILRKLVFCAECGKTMAYKGKVWDNGKKKLCYYSYICPSHERDTESCRVKSIREDTLLEMLWELLKKQMDLAEKLGVEASEIRSSAEWAAKNAEAEREYNNARKNLERLQMLYDSLYPMYADEKALTEQEYMQMKQDYRMRIGQAEKTLETMEEKKRARAVRTEENPWLKSCMAFRKETGVTEEMAHALISRIEVHADKSISVSFRWEDEFRKLAEALEKEGDAHHDKC